MSALTDSKKLMRRSLLHGLPAALLVIALLAYWFGFANRAIVFLYDHDMGALVPDTSPFSRVTASRYWMAGLVAAGFVLILYSSLNWLAGRLRKSYAPPPWPSVWLVCASILLVGVPLITMGTGSPPLPGNLAAAVTLSTLIGVALALMPGKMAARRPCDLAWLAADGWGLALITITLAQIDDIGRWLAAGVDWRIVLTFTVIAMGLGWLLLLTAVQTWRGVFVGDFMSLAVATAVVAYLLLPWMHYVVGTDGYFYITDSDNFLASTVALQIVTWLATAVIIWGLLRLRTWLAARKRGHMPEEVR